jgi:hypothetical protein
MNIDTAINKAKQIFYKYREQTDLGIDFDLWVSVSNEWDLNIWSDQEGVLHATMYSVVNGNTITTTAYSIP